MPVTIHHDRDNIFRVELRGALLKPEFDRCQQDLTAAMDRLGPVRLLFVLDEFDGWEPGANWHDLSFYVRHGDRIERIAIVGPEQWRTETLMFAGADLRRAPVEFFTEDAAADARSWLAS
jgi:hypothetical protein